MLSLVRSLQCVQVNPAMCGDHSAPKDTVFFDAPFGLLRLDMVKTADANGNLATEVPYFIEVLGISEMQG